MLIVAAAIILFLSFHQSNPAADQGVVLNDIFHQQVAQRDSVSSPSIVTAPKQDPVPPMAIVTTPVNNQETDISIQVYSFQDKNRAETALQVLKNNGYQAFLILSDLGEKGTWYRVRVGGIENEAQAHKMLDIIRKNFNSGFILKNQTSP